MTRRSLNLDNTLYDYLLSVQPPEPHVRQQLRQKTAGMPGAQMQIAPEQAHLLSTLVRIANARRVLEIGTFTGYSALAMAEALPTHGQLVTLDCDPKATAVAEAHWREAGVAERITLRLGAAADTLGDMLERGEAGTYDLAFIDADKQNYQQYFDQCLQLVRPGGLIVLDNVLWSGRVADPTHDDKNTRALRTFNARLRDDPRVDYCVTPVADGLTLAVRRGEMHSKYD